MVSSPVLPHNAGNLYLISPLPRKAARTNRPSPVLERAPQRAEALGVHRRQRLQVIQHGEDLPPGGLPGSVGVGASSRGEKLTKQKRSVPMPE